MLYIFDLDGTLTDTLATIAYFGNSALAKNGFPEIPEIRYRHLVGNGRDILIHRMLAEHGADTDENFQRVRTDYDNGYENNMLYLTKPYDGITDSLQKLKERGAVLAVLSNKPTNIVEYVVKTLFPNGLFSYVSGQREDVPIKPSPVGALAIARKFGFSPGECVFIGDTSVDIQTGKNSGMKTVGVLWGFRDREELENAGADMIAADTGEIGLL